MSKRNTSLIGALDRLFGELDASSCESMLSDDVAFLSRNPAFAPLDPSELQEIVDAGELRRYSGGKRVFEIGDRFEALYVVKSGVVEIVRPLEEGGEMVPVAYLGEGDLLGELGVFTRAKHGSRGRVPEGAEVLVIRAESFYKVLLDHPLLAVHFCRSLATRLEGAISRIDSSSSRHRHLEGSLRYFDLCTVLQNLLSSEECTGVFTVHDRQVSFAVLVVQNGVVRSASRGHLVGREAFYQLFQEDVRDMRFSFDENAELVALELKRLNTCADLEGMPSMSLLMEAARLDDELKRFRTHDIPEAERVFNVVDPEWSWPDDADRNLRRIASAVKRGIDAHTPLRRLLDELPYCHHSIYSVIVRLLAAGAIS